MVPFRYYLRVRYIECDAQKVVFNALQFELSIAATRLGTTSFTIGTTFRIAGDEKVIATAETVYVLVDGRTLTKLPISDALRAALQEGAAGRLADHAAFLEKDRFPL